MGRIDKLLFGVCVWTWGDANSGLTRRYSAFRDCVSITRRACLQGGDEIAKCKSQNANCAEKTLLLGELGRALRHFDLCNLHFALLFERKNVQYRQIRLFITPSSIPAPRSLA